MTLKELDAYFNSFLHKEEFAADPSRNGIQIANSDPAGKEITKVAFAVDACEATARRAADLGAGLLFVHHGLFWGHEQCILGSHYRRLRFLLDNNIAQYAAHLPLDIHPELGNNDNVNFDEVVLVHELSEETFNHGFNTENSPVVKGLSNKEEASVKER